MRAVERAGRFEVGAERLFDDDPAPALVFLCQPGFAEPLDDRAEQRTGHRQIEHDVALGAVFGLDLVEFLGEPLVQLGIGHVAVDMRHAGGENSQLSGSNGSEADRGRRIRDKAAHAFGEIRPEIVLRPIGAIDADDREMVRNAAGAHQIVERRHQQPPRQVAAGAEDHHRARRRAVPALRPLGRVVEADSLHAVISICGRHPCGASWWPPNCLRIADRIFSAKVWSCRERNRV